MGCGWGVVLQGVSGLYHSFYLSLFWVLVSSRPSSALRQRDSSSTIKEDEAICCWRNTAHAQLKDLTFHDSAG